MSILGFHVVSGIITESELERMISASSNNYNCVLLVLKSENEDLKICLQQADRQIDSLKKDRDMDKINTGRKAASLESKVG